MGSCQSEPVIVPRERYTGPAPNIQDESPQDINLPPLTYEVATMAQKQRFNIKTKIHKEIVSAQEYEYKEVSIIFPKVFHCPNCSEYKTCNHLTEADHRAVAMAGIVAQIWFELELWIQRRYQCTANFASNLRSNDIHINWSDHSWYVEATKRKLEKRKAKDLQKLFDLMLECVTIYSKQGVCRATVHIGYNPHHYHSDNVVYVIDLDDVKSLGYCPCADCNSCNGKGECRYRTVEAGLRHKLQAYDIRLVSIAMDISAYRYTITWGANWQLPPPEYSKE